MLMIFRKNFFLQLGGIGVHLNFIEAKILAYFMKGLNLEQISEKQRMPLTLIKMHTVFLCEKMNCKNEKELAYRYKHDDQIDWFLKQK